MIIILTLTANYQPMYKEKPLFLTIKKEYFDLIKSGIKKEEYREIKQYYYDRFKSSPQTVIFQNGYNKNSPRIKVQILDIIEGEDRYIIKLGKILK
jgi:PP-loop superfamily ATP-utilizing enzyme